jgi:hypothetical protein
VRQSEVPQRAVVLKLQFQAHTRLISLKSLSGNPIRVKIMKAGSGKVSSATASKTARASIRSTISVAAALTCGSSNTVRRAEKVRMLIRRIRVCLGGSQFDIVFGVAQMLQRLDRVEQALADLDELIADACPPWAHQLELVRTIPGVGPKVARSSSPRAAGRERVVDPRGVQAWFPR